MNIYLLEQNDNMGYDTYDSCVVTANSEEEARQIRPGSKDWKIEWHSTWCNTPDKVIVTLLGKAKPNSKEGIIMSS